MTDVTFILRDGSRKTVTVAAGCSVMQAAVLENVKGIEGECGGCLSCATCHVYVEAVGSGDLSSVQEEESAMLDGVAAERRPSSRLSCQIVSAPGLSGLLLRIPEKQV